MSQGNTQDFFGQEPSPMKNFIAEQAQLHSVSVEIERRRWRWIGHINGMALNAIPRVAMRWTPAGKRKRGRPKLTWRRSVEKEMREVG